MVLQIQVEIERLVDYDQVLEQYISPGGPALAGFRLDSLAAIKPRVAHSPALLEANGGDISLTCIEDRHINPPVLFIQVSAVQVIVKLVCKLRFS